MPRIIGIDFGTTNSVMSIIENGEPVVIPNSRGSRITPSVVSFQGTGELLVGEAAKNQAILHPESTIAAVKRHLGRSWNARINGKLYTATDIAALILKRMKSDAEEYLNEGISQAVITVPAYFNDAQRQSVKDAGKIAGLEVLRIINEPTAAALAYQMQKEVRQNVLVYDLGGGTFDVSILEMMGGEGQNNTIEVLATSGNNYLGGRDFDTKLLEHIVESFKEETGIDLSEDKMAMQKLLEEAEKAKIELSERKAVSINVPFITADANGPKHLEFELTRARFEDLIKDLVLETVGPTKQALMDAGLGPEDIGRVILVGGSTRIPLVQETIGEIVPGKIFKDINPDECVSMGAAIQTGILAGDIKGVVLVDVTPLSLGIKNDPDIFVPIIERNTPIPTCGKKLFTTVCDNQNTVDIEVYQGERARASDNVKIGNFQLTDIPESRRGEPRIEVKFDIDVDGILDVSARDLNTGNEHNIKVTAYNALSDKEINERIKLAEKHADEDASFRRRGELINKADRLLTLLDKHQKDAERCMEQEFVEEFNDCRTALNENLENDDLSALEYSVNSVESLVNEVLLRLNEG